MYAAKSVITSYPFGDFCKALKTSRVTSLNLSECELGNEDIAELGEYVRDATAAVAHIDVSSESTKYSSIPLCAQFPLQNLSGAAKRFLTSIPRVSTAQRTRASVQRTR